MKINNPREKKIYDYIMKDIETNGMNYSTLTNTIISKELDISPVTVRDKVIKLAKRGYFISLVNHFDENDKYFNRKLLRGNIRG
jgi:DNA-binding Lrp family transcriptional regulator